MNVYLMKNLHFIYKVKCTGQCIGLRYLEIQLRHMGWIPTHQPANIKNLVNFITLKKNERFSYICDVKKIMKINYYVNDDTALVKL